MTSCSKKRDVLALLCGLSSGGSLASFSSGSGFVPELLIAVSYLVIGLELYSKSFGTAFPRSLKRLRVRERLREELLVVLTTVWNIWTNRGRIGGTQPTIKIIQISVAVQIISGDSEYVMSSV